MMVQRYKFFATDKDFFVFLHSTNQYSIRMKTMSKFFVGVVLAASMVCVCGVCTSCASSSSSSGEVMYQRSHSKSKVINRNYKVKGNNRNNSKTYHAY